jgi:hypothetical protein
LRKLIFRMILNKEISLKAGNKILDKLQSKYDHRSII